MGGSEGNLRSCQKHFETVLDMRIQDPREHPATTMVSTLWSHLGQDENAARNIAAGGLRFSPNGPPGEAMVEEWEPENATLILKVDGGKQSQSIRRRLGRTLETKESKRMIGNGKS